MYFVEMATVTNLSINGFMMETIHDHISSRRQHYEMKSKDKSIKFYGNGKNFGICSSVSVFVFLLTTVFFQDIIFILKRYPKRDSVLH